MVQIPPKKLAYIARLGEFYYTVFSLFVNLGNPRANCHLENFWKNVTYIT